MNNFKEIFAFIVCLCVLAGFGFYTGFKPEDFMQLIDNASNYLSKTFDGAKKSNNNNIGSKKINIYNGYKPRIIQQQWLEASRKYKIWSSIFLSSKKVVFYIYTSENDDFHQKVSNYLSKNPKVSSFYNFRAMSLKSFKNAPLGLMVTNKVCNSIEECNAQRVKASAASEISIFLENCGKTMCIINPQNAEYVQLDGRNPNAAAMMINALRNW